MPPPPPWVRESGTQDQGGVGGEGELCVWCVVCGCVCVWLCVCGCVCAVMSNAIQDCEVGSRDGLQLGSPIRRIQASSTLCRRHVHWQRCNQCKTALQTPNLSSHALGSEWRQSAKVETAKAELAKAEAKLACGSKQSAPDVEAEFLQQELSALRSGHVGVPQTEPDSSADATARLEEEARGQG